MMMQICLLMFSLPAFGSLYCPCRVDSCDMACETFCYQGVRLPGISHGANMACHSVHILTTQKASQSTSQSSQTTAQTEHDGYTLGVL